MKQFVCYIIVLVIGAAAGMLLSRFCSNRGAVGEVVVRTDTLYLRDTNVYNFPDMFTEIIIEESPIEVPTDSIVIKNDSIAVLPLEQKHYKEKDYEAWVSGYRPQLDSIYIFPETRYITTENISVKPRKRLGIGIQAGYGVGVSSGQLKAFPYIGVGISYNFIQF